MDSEETRNIPDLIVRKCPVNECSQCAMIYINKLIGHRIICKCLCHSLAKEIQESEDKLQGARFPPQRLTEAAPTTTLDATSPSGQVDRHES